MRVFGAGEAWPIEEWRFLLESEDCLFLAYCRPAEGMQALGDIAALGGIGASDAFGFRAQAEILTLGVSPAWQGRGLGALMLDDLLECVGWGSPCARVPALWDDAGGSLRVPGEAAPSVVLEVRADNGRARALYESRGFRAVGCSRGVSGAWDGVLMRKESWDVRPR